ncbi:MAG TPA: tyrosine-protein phosphatase, partial [Candidatus Sulfomarinibacteraceae bacterium]|nr:tyrosine-protein phosphatase [Candidatus Sulfomarinibacteraceae bacterium]
EVYKITLDHYPDAVAEVMRAIAHAPPDEAVVLHCHSGKDRTGIISALLLRLAGVPRSIVAEDYAQSRDCLWPLYEQVVAEAGGAEHVDPWLEPRCPPETMLEMLDHLEVRYGSVRDYLAGAAGLSAEEIERLRERLL